MDDKHVLGSGILFTMKLPNGEEARVGVVDGYITAAILRGKGLSWRAGSGSSKLFEKQS